MQTANFSVLLALPNHKLSEFSQALNSNLPEIGQIYSFPVLNLRPNLKAIDSFDWSNISVYHHIVLTSSYGAELFFDCLSEREVAFENRFLTVGPSVSEVVRQRGYQVAKQASVYSLQNVLEEFIANRRIRKRRFLVVCSEQSDNNMIIEKWRKLDCQNIDEFKLYGSLSLDCIEEQHWQKLHSFISSNEENTRKLVCLSSPEGVKNLVLALYRTDLTLPKETILICLGPKTHDFAQKIFKENRSICAQEYTYQGMLKQIELLREEYAPIVPSEGSATINESFGATPISLNYPLRELEYH